MTAVRLLARLPVLWTKGKAIAGRRVGQLKTGMGVAAAAYMAACFAVTFATPRPASPIADSSRKPVMLYAQPPG